MKDIFSLNNKVAIVSGGYGYLGQSMVKTLAEFGAIVYVAGRSQDKFNQIFQNDSVKFIELDISKMASFETAFKTVFDQEKRIDILVNNAYFGVTNHPEKMSGEEFRVGIDGSLNAVFDAIQAVTTYMKKDGGHVVNISSMYGVEVPDLNVYNGREEFLNPPNYGTAKAGVIHLTKYYAMYLAKYGINVNAISPGPFPSEKVQKDQEFIKRLEQKTVMKRIGTPEDLSGALLLLSSKAGKYITGHNLIVDGGWTI
ncbi:MAG: SDR family oxidoreductase [Crocinitomicaceae bacterium]